MLHQRRAFTMREMAALIAVCVLAVALLAPVTRGARRDGGLSGSLNNVRLILAAQAAYTTDHNLMPMRGTGYTNGQLNGWDTWNFGGKNNRVPYSPALFDEPAYARMLNAYLYPDVGIPRPAGYFSVGSGPTWNFNHGVPSPTDRLALELPVYRSPGDTIHYIDGCVSAPGSHYDYLGTSYELNMHWWGAPGYPGGGSFTGQYNEACNRIRDQAPANYIWIGDKVMTAALSCFSGNYPGEFGGNRMSVCGFRDGRAEYIQITYNVPTTGTYTMIPWTRSAGGAGNVPATERARQQHTANTWMAR
jgi:hypothetical protein